MMDAMLQSARKVREEYLRDLFTFDATLIKLTNDCPQHSRLPFQEHCEEACDFTGFEDEDIRRPDERFVEGSFLNDFSLDRHCSAGESSSMDVADEPDYEDIEIYTQSYTILPQKV
jgi:hypothetical protein